jgi:hypothetical protein
MFQTIGISEQKQIILMKTEIFVDQFYYIEHVLENHLFEYAKNLREDYFSKRTNGCQPH